MVLEQGWRSERKETIDRSLSGILFRGAKGIAWIERVL
jgi:hypothetical protein